MSILMSSLSTSINPTCHSIYTISLHAPPDPTLILTHYPTSQTSLIPCYHHSLTKYLFTPQPLHLSMHPATSVASRACTVNPSTHHHCGERVPPITTLFLLNVETDPNNTSMKGTDITQVRLFLSFRYEGTEYWCALVDWFSHVGDGPDKYTGMWVVECNLDLHGKQISQIIHIDTVIWCAHLIGAYRANPVGTRLMFSASLYEFHTYYVNKYADHHSFEVAVWYPLPYQCFCFLNLYYLIYLRQLGTINDDWILITISYFT